jgi:carbon monoxide dehydrogenase subunit G
VKIEQSFTVAAPPDEVWSALIDVERVAPCLPGAEITGVDEDGTCHGLFTVKLGPTTAKYRGTLKFENVDQAARSATMRGHGSDTRGQGGTTATIVSKVADEDGGARVDVAMDLTITGRLARFGRGGMIEDVTRHLMEQFAASLQQRVAAEAVPVAAEAAASGAGEPAPAPPAGRTPPPPAAPIKGARLVLQVLLRRLRRVFGRGRHA